MMTRQDASRYPADAVRRERSQLLRPLESPRSLSAEVVARLAEQIMSGKLPAGAKPLRGILRREIPARGTLLTVFRARGGVAIRPLFGERHPITREGVAGASF